MKPKISAKDKNVMTFTLAVLTLSLLVLGVSFSFQERGNEVIHSMEVILSKKSNAEVPEEAEFLAANNQIGGGTKEESARPTNPFSATSPIEDGVDKKQTQEKRKSQTKQTQPQVITTQQADQTVDTKKQQDQKNKRADDDQLTKAQRIAKIQDEIAKKIERYAKKPRSKYVSSNTKAYEFAPYINDWIKKIERTGDLNYPEQAKKKSFTGNVMLSVGINRDGSIHEIKVLKGSKHKFLNEAAKHIVHLAQPFDPLPETKEKVDILYITRTWQFLPGHLLRQK